jgi:hypothetical protein
MNMSTNWLRRFGTATIATAAAAVLLGSGVAADATETQSSTVSVSDCSEFLGIAPTAVANARPLVPAEYTLGGDATNARVVVRALRCSSVNVDGNDTGAGTLTQVGVVVRSPDGTGNSNNYLVAYNTNSPQLAHSLRGAGVPVNLVPTLTFLEASSGQAVVANGGDLPFALYGTLSAPVSSTSPFTANWWYGSGSSRIGIVTSVPVLRSGPASMQLITNPAGSLASLLGAPTTTFPAFSSHNIVDSATTVTAPR